MTRRTLSLKREGLQELTSDDLAGIAGGGPTMLGSSHLTHISCNLLECLPTLDDCIE